MNKVSGNAEKPRKYFMSAMDELNELLADWADYSRRGEYDDDN